MFFPHIITCLQMHVMVSTIPKKRLLLYLLNVLTKKIDLWSFFTQIYSHKSNKNAIFYMDFLRENEIYLQFFSIVKKMLFILLLQARK